MRYKKNIQEDIKRNEKLIAELPEKRLGFLLYSLQILGCKDTIKLGNFNFYASKHGTGVFVRVYIENDGETFDVINGTYWCNQSQYGHNKFIQKKGAWDSSLNSAIGELKDKAKSLYLRNIERLSEELESLKNSELEKKKRFEALF